MPVCLLSTVFNRARNLQKKKISCMFDAKLKEDLKAKVPRYIAPGSDIQLTQAVILTD